jgi:hypothetical protein
MYLMRSDYARAVQSLERGQGLASSCHGCHLETISLVSPSGDTIMVYVHSCKKIFGWTFDGLQITVQRYRCEKLYAASRAEEATVVLLRILDTFGEEIHANKVTAEWVLGEY